jgi:hypothetical protein
MLPESQVVASPEFDVAVWAMLSLFLQVTIVPREIVSGLAPNAFVVKPAAPVGIVTVTLCPGGVGEAGVLLLLLLHASAELRAAATRM